MKGCNPEDWIKVDLSFFSSHPSGRCFTTQLTSILFFHLFVSSTLPFFRHKSHEWNVTKRQEMSESLDRNPCTLLHSKGAYFRLAIVPET